MLLALRFNAAQRLSSTLARAYRTPGAAIVCALGYGCSTVDFAMGSRMSGEIHVRFCEGLGVRFPRATHLIVGFEYGADAQWFYQELPKRLAKFGLSMAADKSGILRFSRSDVKGSGCFTFLGFEFYWARRRNGKLTVKRRTSKKKFKASLLNLKQWLRKNRSRPLKVLAVMLRRWSTSVGPGVGFGKYRK